MKTILIIEKESYTANAISRLVQALNFKPVIVFRLDSLQVNRDKVAAIFLNIEIPILNIKRVLSEFIDPQNSGRLLVPVFYLYSREDSDAYKEAIELPHTAKVKKPFSLERIYSLLEKHVEFERDQTVHAIFKDNLEGFWNFAHEFKDWLLRFGKLINE